VRLDNTFGTNGKKTTSFVTGALANCLKIQPDGKILIAGTADQDFAMARFNPDGTADNSFGTSGIFTTDFNSGGDDFANAIALQNDGKILVAGYTNKALNTDFAVARCNPDGSFDKTFGTDGKVITDFGKGTDQATAIAIQTDGKIVVAGFSWNGTNNDFSLTRYNPNGTTDLTFGGNGKIITDFGSSMEFIYSLILKPDGKILVSGFSNVSGNPDFAIAQYNIDGTVDNNFGIGGRSTVDFGSTKDYAYSMLLQPDGKIIVAGSAKYAATSEFAMARFLANGIVDNEFGAGGKLTADVGPNADYASAVSLQADGKIVLSGFSFNGINNDFAMARFTSNGTVDHTFNLTGKLLSPITSSEDVAYSIGIQPDGKILLAGFTNNNTKNEFVIARYITNDIPVNVVQTIEYEKPIVRTGFPLLHKRVVITTAVPSLVYSSDETAPEELYAEEGKLEGNIVVEEVKPTGNYSETSGTETKKSDFGKVQLSIPRNSVVLYPNPVEQDATLEYSLTSNETVTIKVLDFNGKLVKTIIEREKQTAGIYIQPIALPYELASGNYYVTLSSPQGQVSIKIIKRKSY